MKNTAGILVALLVYSVTNNNPRKRLNWLATLLICYKLSITFWCFVGSGRVSKGNSLFGWGCDLRSTTQHPWLRSGMVSCDSGGSVLPKCVQPPNIPGCDRECLSCDSGGCLHIFSLISITSACNWELVSWDSDDSVSYIFLLIEGKKSKSIEDCYVSARKESGKWIERSVLLV